MNTESIIILPGTCHERQTAWFEQAMAGRHGGFAKALAEAFQRADSDNAAKLATGFPELFDTLK